MAEDAHQPPRRRGRELGPNPLSDAQASVAELVEARRAQLVRDALGDLQQWQSQLRALANHLGPRPGARPAGPSSRCASLGGRDGGRATMPTGS
jgi:hypothetical protein